jgi:3-oxoadipate enol-lactonase
MFFTHDDHTLHCALNGPADAPVLVLLHSLGTSGQVWQAQVESLSGLYRVLCPDFRGHGLSAIARAPLSIDRLADDVLALLSAQGVDRFALAGISLGGVVAQAVAARAGARLTGLALFDTYVVTANPAMWRERAAKVRAEGLGAISDGVLSLWMSPDERTTPHGEGLANLLRGTSDEGYAAGCDALENADLRDRVGAIRAPCVVACGALDRAAPPAATEALAAAIPGARAMLIPAAGHIPLLHHAETCTALIETIL